MLLLTVIHIILLKFSCHTTVTVPMLNKADTVHNSVFTVDVFHPNFGTGSYNQVHIGEISLQKCQVEILSKNYLHFSVTENISCGNAYSRSKHVGVSGAPVISTEQMIISAGIMTDTT